MNSLVATGAHRGYNRSIKKEQAMFEATITSKGDDKYHATTRHSQFELASDGSASKPGDALLASLCACLGHYVGDFLKQEKIAFSEYSVRADSDLTQDQSRLADIRVAIEVPGARWNDAAKSAMLKFIRKCYIYGTLTANSPIHLSVVASPK